MNMLIETLGMASESWLSWGVVGLILGLGGLAAYHWWSCPYLCGAVGITPSEAAERLERPFVAGGPFFAIMLGGIGLMLSGLGMIASATEVETAFVILVAGVVVVQTAPLRLRIREAVYRTIAAQAVGPEAMEVARERLRDSHLWLVAMHLLIAATIAAALLVF